MESKYFYQSGMCLKILKTTEFRKYWNQARLSFKRSSGLSNVYMDTTSGLYVLQENKDRINKKKTFPAIKTIHRRSPLCRGSIQTRTKLPLMIFDTCPCCQEFSARWIVLKFSCTLFNFVSQVNRFTVKLRLKLPLQQNRKRNFHLIVYNIFFIAAGLLTFRHE